MPAITIGTAEGIEEIRQRLDDEFRFLQEEGVEIRIGQMTRGNFTFLNCKVTPSPDSPPQVDAMVRHYVASALSDIIVDTWEHDLIRKMIRGTYGYFTAEEQAKIAEYTDRNLAGCDDDLPVTSIYKVSRKSRVLHRLRDYLDGADEVVLEGFVTFRLRDYLEELEDAVDRAVDDYLMEREYREFIRLLKYFVDVQEPRMEHVHVLMLGTGGFRLVDDEGSAIRSDYLEEFVSEMVESEVNYDDLLISALITLAPRRLTVHLQPAVVSRESLDTIQGVFDERVVLCEGCIRCDMPLQEDLSGEAPQFTLGH